MSISAFDLFTIGIGPSSSHTVGPMRAAREFALRLRDQDQLASTARVQVELYGSLALTGRGHGTDKAVLMGLEGETPEGIDVDSIDPRAAAVRDGHALNLLGEHPIGYDEADDLILHRDETLPQHPNGMRFTAFDEAGEVLEARVFFSVGGGFVVREREADVGVIVHHVRELPLAFHTGDELLEVCTDSELGISDVMLRNESAWRSEDETREGMLRIWNAMKVCVERGCHNDGELPGGLKVRRRAPAWFHELEKLGEPGSGDVLAAMDWVNLWAVAVNEENAAGGRVVTAPTNGAAGIIPAVLHYYWHFVEGADEDGVVRFLLTAGAIGLLYKENASISGAEVGCQGEVGSACSMAAAALAERLGGTPEQVENAAEIAMEHNLGLTCDPIGGLVQIPCIERNAMAAVKAINAARMAMRGDGTHFVSLDKVIKTMRDTGADMQSKYKETARGGLAVNVIDMPVSVIEC